jgi:hypothetical protein
MKIWKIHTPANRFKVEQSNGYLEVELEVEVAVTKFFDNLKLNMKTRYCTQKI